MRQAQFTSLDLQRMGKHQGDLPLVDAANALQDATHEVERLNRELANAKFREQNNRAVFEARMRELDAELEAINAEAES